LWIAVFLLPAAALLGQNQDAPSQGRGPKTTPNGVAKTSPPAAEQEPPEEDPDLVPQEYTFNPVEAGKHMTAGNFYFKKGNYRAAARRYLEASRWDPTSGAALLRLGEANEKMRAFGPAREAYEKFLMLAPDPKTAEALKKKMAKFPPPATASTTKSK